MLPAISFDFWNTLFADGDETLRREKRKQLLKQAVQRVRPVSDLEMEHAFDASTAFFLREWSRKTRTPRTAERLQLMCDELDTVLPQGVFDQLVVQYGEMIDVVPPREIKGAKAVVAELATRYRLGIISDTGYISGYYIRRFLEQQNMLHYFQSLIFSDEAGVSKPNYQVFELTANKLGVPCEGLIHIGDLENTDIRGANECGGVSVRFTGAGGDGQTLSAAKYLCASYRELPALIDKIIRD